MEPCNFLESGQNNSGIKLASILNPYFNIKTNTELLNVSSLLHEPTELLKTNLSRNISEEPREQNYPLNVSNFLFNLFENCVPMEKHERLLGCANPMLNISGNTEKRIGHSYQSRLPARHKKPRTSFSKSQVALLENNFVGQKYLASAERAKLASQLNMSDAQVKTWYVIIFLNLYLFILFFKFKNFKIL